MNPNKENMSPDQGSQQDAPGADDEFDAAMAEASAEEASPAEQAADADIPADFLNGTGEPPAPADKAAANAPPADKSPSVPTQDNDIWSKAPAELRDAHEKAQRDAELRLKSIQGRQSASDREAQRLRDQLAAMQAQGQQEPKSDSNANRSSDAAPQEDADTEFKELLDDYPEIAGPLVAKIKALEGKMQPLEQSRQTSEQERQNAYFQQQQDLLTEKEPDWLDTLKDDRFGGWLQEQPRRVQDAFKRNEQAIVDGEEAAWLVGTFKSALGIGSQPQSQGNPQQDQRRARQLANGRDFGRGAGPAATDGIPDDFDSAMEAYAHEADRKNARR